MSFKDMFKSLIDPYSEDDPEFIDEAEESDEEPRSIFSAFRSKGKSAPAASGSAAARPAPAAQERPASRQRIARPAAAKAAEPVRKSSGEVKVFRPAEYETAWDIVAAMANDATVIVNLENTRADIAMRIMDFVLGAAYARKDDLQRVSTRTFIIAPHGRALTGDMLDGPMSGSGSSASYF